MRIPREKSRRSSWPRRTILEVWELEERVRAAKAICLKQGVGTLFPSGENISHYAHSKSTGAW
jgi:hypothetical protein